MPGAIKSATSLINPWTSSEVMSRDDADFTSGDGLLTLGELQGHIDRLAAQRSQLIANSSPTSFVDTRISGARALYKDMVASGATAVQYLPDGVMGLPVALRQRASELLVHDDIGNVGVIDQFVIDHARDRYKEFGSLGGSGSMLQARQRALQEIDGIAAALGLS